MKKIIYVLIFIISVFILNNSINAWSEYKIGKEVEYNGKNYYVIKDSIESETFVTLLKAEPLTVEEVNEYGGVGTENNHVNMYITSSSSSYYRKAYDSNGYGGMVYYSSADCGYGDGSNHTMSRCSADYLLSAIKYVVDAWKIDQAPEAIEARLITYDELMNNLGYNHATCNMSNCQVNPEYTPSWVYNSNYYYWTMSMTEGTTSSVWGVYNDGSISHLNLTMFNYVSYVVRPVIIISKSALGDIDDSKSDDNDKQVISDKQTIPDKQENKKSEISTKVSVANTYLKKSVIIIILGFILAGVGMIILYRMSNKKK